MICTNCRNDVEPEWTDVGIGKYEYWGQKCHETKMAQTCPVCGEELDSEYSYDEYLADLQEDYKDE